MSPTPLDYLIQNQNPNGGWGYAPGEESVVEASAAVGLALAGFPGVISAVNKFLNWLLGNQNPDGGWGITSTDGGSGWQTAWAVLALAQLSGNLSNLYRGVNWLVKVEVAEFAREADQKWIRDLFSFDPNLRGWPWQPGEATFVEPTAITMLALSTVDTSRPIQTRLGEARQYLDDRRCNNGGWNVGNPEMFSKSLPPRAHPSAWAILALDKVAPELVTDQDFAALREEIANDGAPLALAWGILALRSLDRDDSPERAALESLRSANGSWDDNLYATATAMMALDENFKFPGEKHA